MTEGATGAEGGFASRGGAEGSGSQKQQKKTAGVHAIFIFHRETHDCSGVANSGMKLLPRDVKFYDLLLEQSKSVSEAAQQFHDLLEGDEVKRTESAGKLRELARNGVAELRKVEIRLDETFVTPLDPEEISISFRVG